MVVSDPRQPFLTTIRPQIRKDYPLSLSISLSGGEETNQDFPSSDPVAPRGAVCAVPKWEVNSFQAKDRQETDSEQVPRGKGGRGCRGAALGVSPSETASGADLGGSSKYSNENFED
jgi:hypothetical protein